MMKELLILSIIACAVLADNYRCGKPGEVFECFESAPDAKFCLSNGKETTVICSKCRKKIEFCTAGMKESRRPDIDCGAGWDSTPCTPANSDVPATY